MSMWKQTWLMRTGIRVAIALTSTVIATTVAHAQQKVLRAVLHADVRTLDPIWTTQTIAGIHGMIVYDTLFGNDDKLNPQPQMVGKYEISEDKLVYTFTLRDGLKFHDGSPVTTKDVIASLKRWSARDNVGQRLFSFVERQEAVDEKTFRMMLNKPYGMVLESLGKNGTSVAVIMREKDALTDPQQQIKESIGSGPFKFSKDEWVPGSKTVYLKNPDYVPRPGNERASFFAGSKFAGVDRIELVWISDPQTAMSALVNGEIDFWENPEHRFPADPAKGAWRQTDEDRRIWHQRRIRPTQPSSSAVQQREGAAGDVLPDQSGGLPARAHRRSGLLHGVSRHDHVRHAAGERRRQRDDEGVQSEEGASADEGGRLQWRADHDPGRDRSQHDHAGDAGADSGDARGRAQSRRPVDGLGSVVSRRAKKEPPAQGGWNIFVTTMGTVGASNPVLHSWIGAACDKGVFGWPCDAKVEELRSAYAFAQTDAEKKQIARDLQARAIEQVVYIPFGQWDSPYAYRADRLEGIVPNTGLVVLWNITKK